MGHLGVISATIITFTVTAGPRVTPVPFYTLLTSLENIAKELDALWRW